MNIDRYLARIKADIKEPGLEALAHLQKRHMLSIPFENLDVIRKVPISLDRDQFYKKVVENNRGGFCYELNGLFQTLLSKMGYSSALISGTVKTPGGWARENSHAAILVYLDQPYLTDVGFGDSARQPIPLDGTEKEDASGKYKVRSLGGGCYDLMHYASGEWVIKYRFTDEKRDLDFFQGSCSFNQTSAESPFTKDDIITIATVNGRITLSGHTLVKTENGEKSKTDLDKTSKLVALKEFFGIAAE
ncbi:arylamine N-acetyltransferase family protein [Bacillus infantis]|jgi:N-hydroxyarylamine O-acetyltransferase|uniref:arylamine N-acetyltransferase family protein n=1 Tax=Bacillus infantis TaxID=324767 RepID=UPI0021551132|nr:arylamine N-acetyltransferase [Bacillus infantis]MCR6610816.1 arylamine N-acetyltransferase [Bacillus infantis]